jgi:hypothetical protein
MDHLRKQTAVEEKYQINTVENGVKELVILTGANQFITTTDRS